MTSINIYELRVYFQSNISPNQPSINMKQVEEYQRVFNLPQNKSTDKQQSKLRDVCGNPIFVEAGKVSQMIQTTRQYQLTPDMLAIGRNATVFYVTDQIEMNPNRVNIQKYRYFTDKEYLRDILKKDLNISSSVVSTRATLQKGKGKPFYGDVRQTQKRRKRSLHRTMKVGGQPRVQFKDQPNQPRYYGVPYGQQDIQTPQQQILKYNIKTLLDTFLTRKTSPVKIVVGMRVYNVDKYQIMSRINVPSTSSQPVHVNIHLTVKPYTGKIKHKILAITKQDNKILKFRNDVKKRCNPKREKIRLDWEELKKQMLDYGIPDLVRRGLKETGVGDTDIEKPQQTVDEIKQYQTVIENARKQKKERLESEGFDTSKPGMIMLTDDEIKSALQKANMDTSIRFIRPTIDSTILGYRTKFFQRVEEAKAKKELNPAQLQAIEREFRENVRKELKEVLKKQYTQMYGKTKSEEEIANEIKQFFKDQKLDLQNITRDRTQETVFVSDDFYSPEEYIIRQTNRNELDSLKKKEDKLILELVKHAVKLTGYYNKYKKLTNETYTDIKPEVLAYIKTLKEDIDRITREKRELITSILEIRRNLLTLYTSMLNTTRLNEMETYYGKDNVENYKSKIADYKKKQQNRIDVLNGLNNKLETHKYMVDPAFVFVQNRGKGYDLFYSEEVINIFNLIDFVFEKMHSPEVIDREYKKLVENNKQVKKSKQSKPTDTQPERGEEEQEDMSEDEEKDEPAEKKSQDSESEEDDDDKDENETVKDKTKDTPKPTSAISSNSDDIPLPKIGIYTKVHSITIPE